MNPEDTTNEVSRNGRNLSLAMALREIFAESKLDMELPLAPLPEKHRMRRDADSLGEWGSE